MVPVRFQELSPHLDIYILNLEYFKFPFWPFAVTVHPPLLGSFYN